MSNETNPDFAEFITDLSHGSVNQRLTEDLAKVVEAVQETGRTGELTIKLNVKLEGGMAVVNTEVKSKAPKPPLPGTMFFVGEKGLLHREDPRQTRMKTLDAPRLATIGTDREEN